MNYIVLDMEWNQPYPGQTLQKPVLLHGEIIQIGAVRLDERFSPLDTFKILVRPRHYRRIHKKVARLTGITNETLQYGFPFGGAIAYFQKWCGKDFAFLTWGPDDLAMLRDNLTLYGLSSQWLPPSYDLQLIFGCQVARSFQQTSLQRAMELMGEPAFDAHDALNDARNAARLCRHLDLNRGIADYAALLEALERRRHPLREELPVPKRYPSRQAALRDPELLRFYSPLRKESIVCCGVVRQKENKFLCVGQCENGQELLVRLSFSQTQGGSFFVTRLLYDMDESNRNLYEKKKAQASASAVCPVQRTCAAF